MTREEPSDTAPYPPATAGGATTPGKLTDTASPAAQVHRRLASAQLNTVAVTDENNVSQSVMSSHFWRGPKNDENKIAR